MTYLDRILETKWLEVAELRSSRHFADLKARAADMPRALRFRDALARPDGPHLIAELKKASPSKGLIRPDYNPVTFARRYEECGASAISCLTDSSFFRGSIADLAQVRQAVKLPILRKDFILDDSQLYEARAVGADAVLLIVAALETAHMNDLSDRAADLGMDVLVEIHDDEELDRAFECTPPPRMIGINNRDLSSFEIDLAVTERLAPTLPSGVIVVGESGIQSRRDVERMGAAGVHAVLVGETLMRHSDPGKGVEALLGRTTGTLRPPTVGDVK